MSGPNASFLHSFVAEHRPHRPRIKAEPGRAENRTTTWTGALPMKTARDLFPVRAIRHLGRELFGASASARRPDSALNQNPEAAATATGVRSVIQKREATGQVVVLPPSGDGHISAAGSSCFEKY